jgi:hypothetical protein
MQNAVTNLFSPSTAQIYRAFNMLSTGKFNSRVPDEGPSLDTLSFSFFHVVYQVYFGTTYACTEDYIYNTLYSILKWDSQSKVQLLEYQTSRDQPWERREMINWGALCACGLGLL